MEVGSPLRGSHLAVGTWVDETVLIPRGDQQGGDGVTVKCKALEGVGDLLL